MNFAAMRFDDRGNKAEAETESLFRIGVRHAVEAVEDVRQVIFGNANPRVFDDEPDVRAGLIYAGAHPTALWSIFDGVREQISDHAFNLGAVQLAPDRLAAGLRELDAVCFGRGL